jgi:hypothetical protein
MGEAGLDPIPASAESCRLTAGHSSWNPRSCQTTLGERPLLLTSDPGQAHVRSTAPSSPGSTAIGGRQSSGSSASIRHDGQYPGGTVGDKDKPPLRAGLSAAFAAVGAAAGLADDAGRHPRQPRGTAVLVAAGAVSALAGASRHGRWHRVGTARRRMRRPGANRPRPVAGHRTRPRPEPVPGLAARGLAAWSWHLRKALTVPADRQTAAYSRKRQ